jgi:hypothetical protein
VLERIATAHMDLEAAQLNQARAHEKLVGVVTNLAKELVTLQFSSINRSKEILAGPRIPLHTGSGFFAG